MSPVADGEAPEARYPAVCSLSHPAVPSQTLAALDAAPRDAGLDAAGTTRRPAAAMVATLVGMQPLRPSPWATGPFAAHTGDRVQGGCQYHAVVTVGPAQRHPEQRATPVDDEMALPPWLAAIRGVRARR